MPTITRDTHRCEESERSYSIAIDYVLPSAVDDTEGSVSVVVTLNVEGAVSCAMTLYNERLTTYLSTRSEELRLREALARGLIGGSIEAMASICCLSPSAFKRRFRHRYSSSPHSWLLEHRLRIARHLVEESIIPIDDIATIVGFANVSHFIALFKRRYRTTPLAHRHTLLGTAKQHLSATNG